MSEAAEKVGWASYRVAISAFLQERMQGKLDKLKPDDPQRSEVRASFAYDTWLNSAAKRVEQIQAVTHSLKPVHPDARGTNLYVEPTTLPALAELGSHALGDRFVGDAVGNAAALDVYKLLKLEVGGRTLLADLLAEDAGAIAALHDDPAQSKSMRDAFVSLTQPRNEAASSHTLAKQLYWLTGADACTDADYTLFAPLYATSLSHAVYSEVQEARFGEVNKAARAAKRERRAHDNACLDYPDLAVQNMGGTKPQNISQLNSERRGMNYLLSSLPPPQWKASEVRLPVNAASVFDRLFIARTDVRRVVKALRHFLESDPVPNLATRQHREALTDVLIDELVSLAAELHRVMPPGWSRDDDRFEQLGAHEKLWLDPMRAELPEESDFARQWLAMDWPEEIGKAFARWLNNQLWGKLPVGDVEAREWRKELLTDEDGFKQQLRTLRKRLGTAAVEATP
jgi:CRISPR-associated protein Csy1